MIYFKNAEKAKTVNQLLKLGYKTALFQETYKDVEYKNIQCKSARRSFYDLLEICQTYFPKTTEKTLAKLLTKKYFSFYCKTTDLLVFMVFQKPGFNRLMSNVYDENYEDSTKLSYNKVLEFLNN